MSALRPCPACNHPISSAATTCPQCGHPATRRPTPFHPGVAALLSAVVPGAGSLYKGQPFSAAAYLAICAVGYATLWPVGAAFHALAVADALITRRR